MKNFTIRQRILLSFAAILVVLVCVVAVGYSRLLESERQAKLVEGSSLPALETVRSLAAGWADADSLLQRFVRQDTAEGRDQARGAIARNRESLKTLAASYGQFADSEAERSQQAQVLAMADRYFADEDALIARPLGAEDAAAEDDLERQITQIRALLATVVRHHQVEATDATQGIAAAVRHAEVGMSIGLLIALVLATWLGLLLFRAITVPLAKLVQLVGVMREGDFSARLTLDRKDEFSTLANGFNAMADDLTTLIGQVQKSGIQVNTSITQVAATSKEQEATASEIAATTTEIGATAKEIAATSNELVRTMEEVAAVAEQTATLANGGQTGLARMEETMRQVMEAAGAINAKLAVLSEKAGNINQVVTTITKVADQTNLLSLNAAIEAEKAGQYGRGFSVVATEIRRLADQTAASTYDIEQMIKDIQSAVAGGVMGMDKFSEEVRRGMLEVQQVSGQLLEIIHQVQSLAPRFDIANEGMQAQAVGAGQISDALSQLSEAAQQTVESLRQSTSAVEELNQVSSGLRSSISRFKLRS